MLFKKSEAASDRRVHIMHVHEIFNRLKIELIGRSIGVPSLKPTARHRQREFVVIAIVSIASCDVGSLR